MKYSLFRLIDIFELVIIYLMCFTSNSVLMYVGRLDFKNSFVLYSFLEGILDYQLTINIILTFMAGLFHYQFLIRRRAEVSCRILIGDTISNIVVRYILHSIFILVLSFVLSLVLNLYLSLKLTNNLYLMPIFIFYIIFSASQVKRE